MKPYLISIFSVFLIIIYVVQAQTAVVETTETLVKKGECLKCHGGVDDMKRVIAPGFHDMAARYRKDTVSIDVLMERVTNGSKGYWTDISRGIPMPPYKGRLSDEEIRSLVEWMLKR